MDFFISCIFFALSLIIGTLGCCQIIGFFRYPNAIGSNLFITFAVWMAILALCYLGVKAVFPARLSAWRLGMSLAFLKVLLRAKVV